MKITLPNGTKIEMDDPEPMEETPEPEAEAKAEAAPAPKPEPAPKPKAMVAAAPIPKEEPGPAGSGDFAHMGGISNVSDPQKDNKNVFHFQMPREE